MNVKKRVNEFGLARSSFTLYKLCEIGMLNVEIQQQSKEDDEFKLVKNF